MSRVPSSSPNDVVTNFRQTADEKTRWQTEADAQGVSLTALIRHAVNEYVEQREKLRKKSRK